MFKKLLDLFKKKQELELSIDELEQWLRTKKISITESLEPVCKELLGSLNEYLDELKDNIDKLQKAEIKDKDKIEQRIVTIVLGNRKSFINQTRFFINRICLPSYENVKLVIEFSNKLKQELDSFAKTTHKSFYAAQHLFYKEAENIKKSIKKISKINDNFDKKIKKSKIIYFKDVENNVNLLKSSVNSKYSLLKSLNQLKIRLEKVKEDKESYEEKIKEIKISPNYKYFLEEKEKLSKLENEIKKLKLKLEHNFAVIEYALKKYTKIADEEFKLIYGYQVNAFDTLLEDKEFKILEILQKITQKILSNEIVLKDSKKQKILAEINLINRNYLGEIIKEYRELEKDRKQLSKEINENKTINEINETKEQIISLDKEFEKTGQDINNLNKNINKIDVEKIKEIIEEQFNSVFDAELKVLVEDDS